MSSISNSSNGNPIDLNTLLHTNKSEPVGSNPGRNESLANVEIAVLSIILVLAIVGNSLMLLALRRQLLFRPMSRMYFFMLNLSMADLMVAFGNILPQLAWDITFRFKGNDLLCRVVKFLQIFVLYLSTYILTSMAVDRYLVVCHHSFTRNHYGGLKGPKMLVILSWILSFIFASPQAFIFSLKEISDLNQPIVYDCWVTFIEPWGARAYVTWFVICAFILPLIIIGISYGAICCKVISFNLPSDSAERRRLAINERKKHSVSSSSDRRGETDSETVEEAPLQRGGERGTLRKQISRAKIKTLKLTLVIVICFFVCWAPFCITQLVLTYNPPEKEAGPFAVILLLLAALNSCTNPWIYLGFSESLYNQLRVCLGFGMSRGSDEESIGDEQNCPDHGKKNVKAEVLERIKPTPMGRVIHSSIEHRHERGDRIQPETKSDVL